MGFVFSGEGSQKVCYISDISRMPSKSLSLLQAQVRLFFTGLIQMPNSCCHHLSHCYVFLITQGPLELLIVDALSIDKHATHYSVGQAVELCRVLRPTRALLVGMGSQLEHEQTNRKLRELMKEGIDVQLAYDGMVCEVDL